MTIRYVIRNSIKKENNKEKNLQKTCGAKVDQNSDMNRWNYCIKIKRILAQCFLYFGSLL